MAEVLLRKYEIRRCFVFPPYLSSASALPRRQRTGALYVQHSPTSATLSTSFILNHATQQLRAERIDYKI